MFDVLENHSGKICIVLVGATLAGGAILVFGAPAFTAAYVTAHAVELFGVGLTVGAGVGSIASGISYSRRESANRNFREQIHDQRESTSRTRIGLERARVAWSASGDVGNSVGLEAGEERERLSVAEADINSLRSEMRTLKGLYRNLSRSQARQEIEDERRRYEAGDYSDSDSSTEESKQPLLSERNMFQRPVTRTSTEIAANDESQQHRSTVVHRRRTSNGSN